MIAQAQAAHVTMAGASLCLCLLAVTVMLAMAVAWGLVRFVADSDPVEEDRWSPADHLI